MTAPPPIVRLRQVAHAYVPDHFVIADVTFDIAPGETVALLGESGAGKSTILRCLNGLIVPTRGTVSVQGQALGAMSEAGRARLRRGIGMIFQQFNVHERLTVLDNALVGRLGYTSPLRSCVKLFPADDVALARACLEQVGLADYAARRVRQLSGGQKQRVGIARALAQEPALLLGDEPTANLDVRTAREILSLLRDINRQRGVTLILTMHDVELAREFCARVVGIRDGRVVFDGPSAAVDRPVLERIFY